MIEKTETMTIRKLDSNLIDNRLNNSLAESNEINRCGSGIMESLDVRHTEDTCCGSNVLEGKMYIEELDSDVSAERCGSESALVSLPDDLRSGLRMCGAEGVINIERWKRSREKVGPSGDANYKEENIWIEEPSGARWLKKISDEGIITRNHFNMFTDMGSAKEDKVHSLTNSVEDLIAKSAIASGFQLKIVGGGNNLVRPNYGMHDPNGQFSAPRNNPG